MLSIAVCDDDRKQCSYIARVLSDYKSKSSEPYKISVFYTGEELYQEIKNGKFFGILYLDIELVKMNGIEVGKKIRYEIQDELMQIIYVSSFSQYMKSAFWVQPITFIEKPFKPQEVCEALEEGIRRIKKQREEVFQYKMGRDECKILIRDILYFKSHRREVEMVTKQGSIFYYASLSKIYQDLEAYDFFYPNRSYLVNYLCIKRTNFQYVTMTNGEIITVSPKYQENIKKFQ